MSYPLRAAAVLLFVWALVVPSIAGAYSIPEWDAPTSIWAFEFYGGLVRTSGNTDSTTIRANVDLENERPDWRHRLRMSSLHSQHNGNTTGERYVFDFKTDYKFAERDYFFGAFRYERDRFAGIDYRSSRAIGYGRRFVDQPWLVVDGEIGAGYRQLKPVNEPSTTEAILRNSGEFRWDISESARFSQTLLVESSGEETFTEAESILRTELSGRLGVRMSYTVRHQDSAPADVRRTDTIFAANLSYEYDR